MSETEFEERSTGFEERSGALTRAGLFKVLGTTGAGAMAAALIDAPAALGATRANRATDREILQFGLVLEHLGAAFYTEALRRGHLRGEARRVATVFRLDERVHVYVVSSALRKLGARPARSPGFDFGDATASRGAFLRTSATLEEMCVEILNGAGPLVSKDVLAAAARLVSVEARQAAWVRDILGRNPAPTAFTPSLTAAQGQARLRRLGFVRGL